MPRLLMKTEDVSRLVLEMQTLAEKIKTNNNQIKNKADSIIPASWDGGSSLKFMSKIETFLNKYNTKAKKYDDLSKALEREVSEWDWNAKKLS